MASFIRASMGECGCTCMTCGLFALTLVELQQMVVEVCSRAFNSGEWVSYGHSTAVPPECDELERAGCDVSDGLTEFSSACPVCLVHSVSMKMCCRFLVFLDAVQYWSVLNARLWNSLDTAYATGTRLFIWFGSRDVNGPLLIWQMHIFLHLTQVLHAVYVLHRDEHQFV